MKKSKRSFKRWERIIKEDRDWDFVYIWILERTKISHMLKYWEEYTESVTVPYKSSDEKCNGVLRDLRICLKLLDIMISDTGDVWEIESPGFHTEKIPGKELWRLVENDPKSPGNCKRLRYFNPKNMGRILPRPQWESIQDTTKKYNNNLGFPNHISCNLENEMRVQKARYLYHKIRLYKEEVWWE